MKTGTTKKLASTVMFIMLTPFLTLAMLLSVEQAGFVGNEVLLLLLVLSGAVLSGINGFGRRVTKVPVTSGMEREAGAETHRLVRSTPQSTNA